MSQHGRLYRLIVGPLLLLACRALLDNSFVGWSRQRGALRCSGLSSNAIWGFAKSRSDKLARKRIAVQAVQDSQGATTGLTVVVDFDLTRDDTGEVVDSSAAKGPLEFVCGSGQVFPALESGVVGMNIGDIKSFPVTGNDGFGHRDEGKVVEVSAASMPLEAVPGQMVRVRGPEGAQKALVVSRNTSAVILDFNHPFAGLPLTMTVTLKRMHEPADETGTVDDFMKEVRSRMAENGRRVAVHFNLTRDDTGEVVDSSEGKHPLEFVCGEGQAFPALDAGVAGMMVGESKGLALGSDAFGEKDDDNVVEIKADRLPATALPGQKVELQGQDGPMQGIILSRNDDVVVLDFNHPFAGLPLTMTVTLMSVQPERSSFVSDSSKQGYGPVEVTRGGSSGEEPEVDELSEVISAGGDPAFLDDADDEEWDGKEDDSAHFD